METTTKKLTGGCHCGLVRFEAEVDLDKPVSRCNCTICTKLALSGALVKPDAFKVLKGEDKTSMYEWGGKTGQRYFCSTCGVHCFGRGHLDVLGGAYVSLNLNCIDDIDPAKFKAVYWDGRHNNWMAGPRPEPWPVETVKQA